MITTDDPTAGNETSVIKNPRVKFNRATLLDPATISESPLPETAEIDGTDETTKSVELALNIRVFIFVPKLNRIVGAKVQTRFCTIVTAAAFELVGVII